MSCGASTAPGSPGREHSQQHVIEYPCQDHDRAGVIGRNCPDCRADIVYLCGDCADGPIASDDSEERSAMQPLPRADESPIH